MKYVGELYNITVFQVIKHHCSKMFAILFVGIFCKFAGFIVYFFIRGSLKCQTTTGIMQSDIDNKNCWELDQLFKQLLRDNMFVSRYICYFTKYIQKYSQHIFSAVEKRGMGQF